MSKIPLTASEQRRSNLLSHSTEVLSDLPHVYGTQSFILSQGEAAYIGEAIHARNHRAIESVVGGVLNAAVEDYTATEANECIGIWNQTFSTLFGEGITMADLVANNDTKDLLNSVLNNSEVSQLGMETTEYLKLIESIAVLTMPDSGFRNPSESRRARTGGTDGALFARSIRILDTLANTEPGIRTVRQDILNTDPNALGKYFASLVRARSAQDSLATIIEMDEHTVRRQKAGLKRTIDAQPTDESIEVEDLLHVLEWKLLTGDEDRETQHKKIKRIIEGQSKTERQRRQLDSSWCPERLDFLIEIAQLAAQEGRHPSILISNRFEEGAGVYVAVELDNPHDSDKKMLFADNPIAGNALYIVDEVKLLNEGRPNNWQKVLGANRRIARERGAVRKYHTKNWQNIIDTVMAMGDDYIQAVDLNKISLQSFEDKAEITEGLLPEDLAARYNALKIRSSALMAAATRLLS